VFFCVGSLRGPRNASAQSSGAFVPVAGSTEDKLIVPPGYTHTVLLRWGDPLAAAVPELDPMAQTAAGQAQQFGYNCDFIGYLPLPQGSNSSTRGLLGVNHEFTVSALMFPGWDGKLESTTPEMVDISIAAHGFTIVEVVRGNRGEWTYVRDSAFNRRLTGTTPMAIRGPAAGHPYMRTSADPSGLTVLGTLNNCAGGVTPWGTVLTGEENIWLYFTGKVDDLPDEALRTLHARYRLGADRYAWGRYHDRFNLRKEPHEPNRFGWVVEIDPYDPQSVPVKHTALGRMAHEGASIILAKDGRPVAYMGDDARFEYLYKFVAAGRYAPGNRQANMQLLDSGTLYVARFGDDGAGEWLPLTYGQGPLTEANGFRSQAEVVINTRRAADLLGATKMDRPEDVEPNPVTGKVYCVMTGNDQRTAAQLDKANPRANNKFGHIIELIEDGGEHTATTFRWEIFLLAGDPQNPQHAAYYQGRTDVSPLATPDNLAFDDAGRMWVATDGVDDTLGPNDGVWVVATEGPERGRALQFLSGPVGCEVCGPAFTPDQRTFFVAIQHPGVADKVTYDKPASRWPDYRPDMPPRPSVVAIYREDGGQVGA
jgi:secreted PhoX family phosphatase